MNAATPTSHQPPLPMTPTLGLSLSLTAQMREQLGKSERERQRQRDEFAQELGAMGRKLCREQRRPVYDRPAQPPQGRPTGRDGPNLWEA